MNNRIRELAKQAGIQIKPMILDGEEYDYEEVFMDGSDDLNEFAQLIIKDCINNVKEWEKDSRNHISYMLKNHFGVE